MLNESQLMYALDRNPDGVRRLAKFIGIEGVDDLPSNGMLVQKILRARKTQKRQERLQRNVK